MKKTNLLLVLGATLLCSSLSSTFAQSSWQTTDNLADSRGRDIVVDPVGNFISLAIDNKSGATGAVSTAVNLSSDHGATWHTVGIIAGYALKLAATPDGALFASGNRSATVSGRAFVWQSLDHGATWTESDPWAGQSTTLLCNGVAAGNSGALYVTGGIYAGGRWIVRKGIRTPGGIIWTTSDDIPGSNAFSVSVRPDASGQPDQIFVAGNAIGCTMRRSLDGGATWATVDNWNANVYGVTTAPGNAIYVLGRTTTTTYVTNKTVIRNKVVVTVTSTTEGGMSVRKSNDGGLTWATVDHFPNSFPSACHMSADSFGRVFVTGRTTAANYSWIVRGSADAGMTWTTTDIFFPAGATSSQALAVAADALGNVCVIGELHYDSAAFAPIRRLAAP